MGTQRLQILAPVFLGALLFTALACLEVPELRVDSDVVPHQGSIRALGAAQGGFTLPNTDPGDPLSWDTTSEGGPDAGADLQAGDGDDGAEANDSDTSPTAVALYELSPGEGLRQGGTLVTLSGDGFVEGARVFFGDEEALDPFVISSEYINVHTPPGPPGLHSVRVLNPDGGEATLEGAFFYLTSILIDSMSPSRGLVEGGTLVTLTGDGFVEPVQVYLGGRQATLAEVHDLKTLSFRSPPGVEGSASLLLRIGEDLHQSDQRFEYFARPRLDAIRPASAEIHGAEIVRLLGVGLRADSLVRFGPRRATVLSCLPGHHLDVRVPAGEPGASAVFVENEDGQAGLEAAFWYYGAESLTDPATGPTVHTGLFPGRGDVDGGEELVLFAGGLRADARVSFDGAPATILSVDPERGTLHLQTPPSPHEHSPGVGPSVVHLIIDDHIRQVGSFVYEAPARIDAISPGIVAAEGGEIIEISVRALPDGALRVRFDATETLEVERIDEGRLRVVTPPGSPGPTKVSLVSEQGTVGAEGLLVYGASERRLVTLEPRLITYDGGTLVSIYGTELSAATLVSIGGEPCEELEVLSSIQLRCRSPKLPIGSWPLTVLGHTLQSGWLETLDEALTTVNPVKKSGGTSGGALEGALTVSVIEGGSGQGLANALVTLQLIDGSSRAGLTNGQGHHTFSFPELVGPVDISGVKEGYNAYSVLGFSARRVSFYLSPKIPPETGEGPPNQATQKEYGKVTGEVINVDKFISIPPMSCAPHEGLHEVQCQACEDESDCGGDAEAVCVPYDPASIQPGEPDEGDLARSCLLRCESSADCPETFACAGIDGGAVVCIPRLGEKRVRCALTKSSLFAYTGSPTELAEVSEHGAYQVVAKPGDAAVVCTAGIETYDDGRYIPLVMGVKRNIFVPQGSFVDDQDVLLDVPLNREVTLRLLDLPKHPEGLRPTDVRAFISLGVDGVIELELGDDAVDEVNESDGLLRLQGFPSALGGSLAGGRYAFYATARADTSNWYPYSVVLEQDLEHLTEGGVLMGSLTQAQGDPMDIDGEGDNDETSAWSLDAILTERDIRAFAGTSRDDLWAVGAGGLIAHYNGVAWYPQFSGTDADLADICQLADGSLLVVGSAGTVLWRAPGQPFAPLDAGTESALSACTERYDTADDAPLAGVLIGGEGLILRREQGAWHKTYLDPEDRISGFTSLAPAEGQGADPSPGELYAWASNGAWYHKVADYWTSSATLWGDEPLISGAGPWLLSPKGTVFEHRDGAWSVSVALDGEPRAIAARGERVCVAGERGALWCKTGAGAWQRIADLPEETPDLLALLLLEEDEIVAAGRQARGLGPFMAFPSLTRPSPGAVLPDSLLRWALADDINGNAAPPSFHQISLIEQGAGTFWTLMAAGDVRKVRLPPGPIPSEQLLFLITSSRSPKFDIDHYRFSDAGTTKRHSWAMNYQTLSVLPALLDFGTNQP